MRVYVHPQRAQNGHRPGHRHHHAQQVERPGKRNLRHTVLRCPAPPTCPPDVTSFILITTYHIRTRTCVQ
jgi:hypothetical protein|eukprot:COSAG01_NODE_3986_length_5464_cov_13.193780_6_plen_70_part_00